MSSTHPFLQKSWARWLLLFVATVFVFASLEIGVRIFLIRASHWNSRIGAAKQFDEVTKFRNKPDYHFRSGAVTNERGFLAPAGLDTDNPADRLRIVFMGDSVTFLPTAANHPRQLERLLTEGGLAVETVNAAVPGFASQEVRALFETEVATFDADWFVVNVGWNDIGQYGPEGLPYKRHEKGYSVTLLQKILGNIYSVRLVYAIQRHLGRAIPAFDAPLAPADARLYAAYRPRHFEENVGAVLDLAMTRYSQVFLMNLASVTSPEPTEHQLATAHFPLGMDKNMRKLHALVIAYNEAIDRIAGARGVPVIDIYSAFQNPEARAEMTDSCHVRRDGAIRIARTALRTIETQVPDLWERSEWFEQADTMAEAH